MIQPLTQNGPLLTIYEKWIPNDGPLTISLPNNQPIGSVYISKVDVAIAVSATPTPVEGNPFYTASPPSGHSNPQTITLPPKTTQVSLSATSSETYYVVATSGLARLLMEGPSAT